MTATCPVSSKNGYSDGRWQLPWSSTLPQGSSTEDSAVLASRDPDKLDSTSDEVGSFLELRNESASSL
ncbi:hypothetical protein Tco_0079197 [Tanacetum coccineum]